MIQDRCYRSPRATASGVMLKPAVPPEAGNDAAVGASEYMLTIKVAAFDVTVEPQDCEMTTS